MTNQFRPEYGQGVVIAQTMCKHYQFRPLAKDLILNLFIINLVQTYWLCSGDQISDYNCSTSVRSWNGPNGIALGLHNCNLQTRLLISCIFLTRRPAFRWFRFLPQSALHDQVNRLPLLWRAVRTSRQDGFCFFSPVARAVLTGVQEIAEITPGRSDVGPSMWPVDAINIFRVDPLKKRGDAYYLKVCCIRTRLSWRKWICKLLNNLQRLHGRERYGDLNIWISRTRYVVLNQFLCIRTIYVMYCSTYVQL